MEFHCSHIIVVIHFLSWPAFKQVSSTRVLCTSLAVLTTLFGVVMFSSWKRIFVMCLLQPHLEARRPRSSTENFVNSNRIAPNLTRNHTPAVNTRQNTTDRYNHPVRHWICVNWTLWYSGILLRICTHSIIFYSSLFNNTSSRQNGAFVYQYLRWISKRWL